MTASVEWRQTRDRALLALERSRNQNERRDAADLLVQLAVEDAQRSEELAAHIPRLLEDRDPRVRRKGLALAARVLPEDEAVTLLTSHVRDPSDELRIEATGQLADLARPDTRGTFALALEDPDRAVRFEAARGMAALKHSAGLDILIDALNRDHLRFRALGALAELGDVKALPAIQKLHARWLLPGFERTQAAGAMAKLGDPTGAQWLFERTKKKSAVDRPLAIELLGEVRAEGAQARLLELLRDPSDPGRGAAARGLGRMGVASADIESALGAVMDETSVHPDVLLDAAEGLCLLRTETARERVRQRAQTVEDAAVRAELNSMLEDYA